MDNDDIENLLQNWIDRSSRDKPFEWKGDLSFFELMTACFDKAIIDNQPISLENGVNYAIARRKHEHNIDYFKRHHPLGCDENGIIKACQILDLPPDRARFCAAIAIARTKNSLKFRNGDGLSDA